METPTTPFVLSAPDTDMRLLTVGFGWRIKQNHLNLQQRLGLQKSPDFDIDAMALLLDGDGKVVSLGIERDLGAGKRMGLVDSDLIFFNNLIHPTQAIWHGGGDLPGGIRNDKEQIMLRPDGIPETFVSIRFFISIHHGINRKQHFGEVQGIYVHMMDAKGKEVAFFEAPRNFGDGKTTLLLAELKRDGGVWTFGPMMDELDAVSFVEMLRDYI